MAVYSKLESVVDPQSFSLLYCILKNAILSVQYLILLRGLKMIDFSFTKAQEEFREAVKRFAREEVKPKIDAIWAYPSFLFLS